MIQTEKENYNYKKIVRELRREFNVGDCEAIINHTDDSLRDNKANVTLNRFVFNDYCEIVCSSYDSDSYSKQLEDLEDDDFKAVVMFLMNIFGISYDLGNLPLKEAKKGDTIIIKSFNGKKGNPYLKKVERVSKCFIYTDEKKPYHKNNGYREGDMDWYACIASKDEIDKFSSL